MPNPKVTVLMSVYNGEKYLEEAIDSIISQTFIDYEFLIIDDASTDRTLKILRSYRNPKIRIIVNEKNLGLTRSLNKGLALAKGEYIVRMDADDISLRNRLEKQVEFMDEKPEVGISGTWIRSIGDLRGHVWKYPCIHEIIKSKLLFESTLAHPSTIIRKDMFLECGLLYDENVLYAQDYELWSRAIKKVKFANIPKILLHYRIYKSTTNKEKQSEVANKVRLAQIVELGINPTRIEFETHEALSTYRIESSKDFILIAKLWLEKLHKANLEMKLYPEPFFSNVLANYWYHICCNSKNVGLNSWKLFNDCELNKSANLSHMQKLMLLLKPTGKDLLDIFKGSKT